MWAASTSKSAALCHQENVNRIAQSQIKATGYISYNLLDNSILPKEMIETQFNILQSSPLVQ